MPALNIISWNVNGIRAVVKKGFVNFLKKQAPDILCLQEVKISNVARDKETFDFAGYQEFWNSAERPGYSGTAILVRDGLSARMVDKISWDNEGRILVLDLGHFYVVNVYFPNANDALSRLDFKIKFNNKLLAYLKKWEEKKPIVIVGDYNVAHKPIDLARPKENEGSAGYTKEERAWMGKFLASGFKDTFRELHPSKVQYSWWSFRSGARERNVGWRIDYVCVSDKLMKKVNKAYILDQVLGSDHAPVGIEIKV